MTANAFRLAADTNVFRQCSAPSVMTSNGQCDAEVPHPFDTGYFFRNYSDYPGVNVSDRGARTVLHDPPALPAARAGHPVSERLPLTPPSKLSVHP